MATLRAQEASWERFRAEVDAAMTGSPRFPNGSAFVAADAPDAGRSIVRYHDEGVPVVLVDADGTARLLLPGVPSDGDGAPGRSE